VNSAEAQVFSPRGAPGVVEYDTGRTHLCAVRGTGVNFLIEPLRHKLGLTRVEMVDEHLRGLVGGQVPRRPGDVDALLDARSLFAAAERC